MSQLRGHNTIINLAVFIILEVASLVILSSFNKAQQLWINQFSIGARSILWGRIDKVHGYFSLRKENDSLKQDNLRMYRLTRSMASNAALQTKPWYTVRMNYNLLPASVVTMTTGSQHNYIIIDRGRADGVMENDGIMTEKGVIGIVNGTTEHFASAVSFINQDMVTSAKVGHEGTVGSLRWTGGDIRTFNLSGIPIHMNVEIGDTVFTSGFSEFFPPEIPLGTVRDKRSDSGSSIEMDVEVFEDMRMLHHVLVVKNTDKEEIESLTK